MVLVLTMFNVPSKTVYAVQELTLDQKIDKYATEYHVNPVVARAIISCESGGDPNALGTMAVIGQDIGIWQINDYFHEETANKLGLNIYNQDNNLRYGMILLFEQGTSPWKWSKSCWSKKLSIV